MTDFPPTQIEPKLVDAPEVAAPSSHPFDLDQYSLAEGDEPMPTALAIALKAAKYSKHDLNLEATTDGFERMAKLIELAELRRRLVAMEYEDQAG